MPPTKPKMSSSAYPFNTILLLTLTSLSIALRIVGQMYLARKRKLEAQQRTEARALASQERHDLVVKQKAASQERYDLMIKELLSSGVDRGEDEDLESEEVELMRRAMGSSAEGVVENVGLGEEEVQGMAQAAVSEPEIALEGKAEDNELEEKEKAEDGKDAIIGQATQHSADEETTQNTQLEEKADVKDEKPAETPDPSMDTETSTSKQNAEPDSDTDDEDEDGYFNPKPEYWLAAEKN